MDVTEWLIWFLACLGQAIERANALTGSVLEKDAFWRGLKEKSIGVSDRQKKVINMLLDAFGGKLTTEKWAKLTKSSHDTALRKKAEEGVPRTAWCALASIRRYSLDRLVATCAGLLRYGSPRSAGSSFGDGAARTFPSVRAVPFPSKLRLERYSVAHTIDEGIIHRA